jgi:hypothetical protein
MPAEWIERSGVFKIGTVFPTVDIRTRLEAMLEGRRSERLSRPVLDVLEGHANGILESYLLEVGIVFTFTRWSIVLRAAKSDPRRALLYARDPRGALRTIARLEEEVARWCAERASAASL